METVRFIETLPSTSQSTRRLNPEEHHHFQYKMLSKPIIRTQSLPKSDQGGLHETPNLHKILIQWVHFIKNLECQISIVSIQ
jgi:hypothetical protein